MPETDGTRIKFTMGQILAFFGTLIPILIIVAAGYMNIIVKLTELDVKITTSNTHYDTVCKKVNDLEDRQIELRLQLEKHKSNHDAHKEIK